MTDRPAEIHEKRILGTELLWAFGVGVLVAATLTVVGSTWICGEAVRWLLPSRP